MIVLLIAVVAAIVPTIVELRRDGSHRLDEHDDWRELTSHRVR